MADDEEYELVPHKIVSDLKKEVDDLKQNPFGGSTAGNDLQGSMNALAHSINDLLTLFKDATDQMRMEEKDSQVFTKRLDPMLEKLDTIIDQNQKIAKGILAVADMLKEHLRHKPRTFMPGPPMERYQQPMPQVPRMQPPQQGYRSPFPEFKPMTDGGPMPRPSAPMDMSSFNPGDMGMVPPNAPRSIPPAPPPPKSLFTP